MPRELPISRHAAERNASLLEKPGQRVSGLHLEKPDLLDIVGWRQVPAKFLPHGRGRFLGKLLYDFGVFQ